LGKYKELGEANLPDLSTTPVNYAQSVAGNRQQAVVKMIPRRGFRIAD
jgi:hypothetical protein